MRRRSVATCLALALAGAGLLACTPNGSARTEWNAATPGSASTSDLPVASVSTAAPVRLADGVTVPTSRWYSSLVFSEELLPVFPYPLAVLPRTNGLEVSLPQVTASATTIAAPFGGGLSLTLPADELTVSAADAVSVTLSYLDAGEEVATVTLAEGSPIVGVVAARDLDIAWATPHAEQSPGVWSSEIDGVTYGITAPESQYTGTSLRVPEGSAVQVFAVPEDSTVEAWAAAIGTPVSGVDVSYRVGSENVSTRLDYLGTERSIIVPFGGREAGVECELGTFDTAYGRAPACAATRWEWSAPTVAPAAGFDLESVSSERRTELLEAVRNDLAATEPLPADTYYGGKALARLGAMLTLARSLDDAELAAQIADRLWTELQPWTDVQGCAARAERCFVFDDRLNLVVGKVASFGSEEGNDHHFHYGYFLAAGAALVAERPELLPELTPVLDVLAADIAGGGADLSAIRVFDPYRGHAWAGGLSIFADGNNQESSSESVNAWNSLALWAQARGADELEARAQWLLSSEADSATRLWLDPDLSAAPPAFTPSMVSLNWSGKRDYATWFSAEPSAILGIQLLPLTQVSLAYLPDDPDRVRALVDEAGGEAAFDGALGDYVLLYSAVAGEDELRRATELAQSRTQWDDGLSRSAVLAWLSALEARAD